MVTSPFEHTPSPYVTISTHFRIPPPPRRMLSFLNDLLTLKGSNNSLGLKFIQSICMVNTSIAELIFITRNKEEKNVSVKKERPNLAQLALVFKVMTNIIHVTRIFKISL